ILSGKPEINRYQGAGLEIIHPDIEVLTEDMDRLVELGRIIPVYHTTEGLYLKSLRSIMKTVLDQYGPLVEEILPKEILDRNGLLPRKQALQEAHFPSKGTAIDLLQNFRAPAQLRLIFEEMFLIQLGLAYRKKYEIEAEKGVAFKTRGDTLRQFVKLLKFDLTGAQKKVLAEIMDNLERDRPMNRLLQGDVGSGKTIVALITLLTAVDNGFQGALMAPTEILAEQHFFNIKPYCDALSITLQLVTSASTARERKVIQQDIREGKTQIVVGTHALIQKDIQFQKLGAVIVDEQHRFGVLQREALGKKGWHPHVLVMTATPIPRSLALTLYGDMDISILDEMPPGRQPITTKLYTEKTREQAYRFLRREIFKGRQAYVVCPLIEESETRDLKTAIEVQEYLQKELFPDLVVRLIHGKIKKEERQQIMAAFQSGKIHILVATTVIEVGIDIPNSTLMVVEHAERFGLSQLHQLRGRVGRGIHPSYCFLIRYYPMTPEAKDRLHVMQTSSDGFVIAEEDLRIRGPGDFMGTRQSGLPELKVANLVRDVKIIEQARKEAFALIEQDPKIEQPQHQKLKEALDRYLDDRLDFIKVL
ncbi:MAG: ATP-dependent DNA helicase RecG, partial [Nitrospinales bacterium]